MNYSYCCSEDVAKDIELANSLSDDMFEKVFNLDCEDRGKFINELKSDYDELSAKEEREENEYYARYTDDWMEAYADMRLYL